jgi:UDP-glucose 4-epimerase
MEIKNKIVFITGGLGFIGSHLVRRFIAEGAKQVIIYDNYTTGRKEYVDGLNNVKIIKGDILDVDLLTKSMKGADIVSHHAAELEVFNGIENVIHECQVNTVGTVNVLTAAVKNNVKKLAYASSGGVYGQAKYIPEDENHPLLPHWPYGVSKLAGEKYCQQFTQLFNLPTVSFRYGIVYGPHEWYGRVFTMFVKRTLAGKAPVVFGDGQQKRDFVYVDDVVEANMLGIKNDNVDGMAFNIGGASHVNVVDIANEVVKIIDPKLKPVFDDPKPGEASKLQPERRRLPGELQDFILDNTLAKKMIGYVPKTKIAEGFKVEIDWIRKHPECWDYAPRV